MNKPTQTVASAASVGRVSPSGRNPTSHVRVRKDVGLRDDAANPTYRATTLGQICESQGGAIQTGPFGSQLHTSDYKEVGIPVVMPTNIGDGGIVEDGIARIDQVDVDRLSQHKLRLGDIVFSRRGDVTKNALIGSREIGWFCGTGCLKVRLGNESIANAKFISHCLRQPEIKDWLTRHAVGATMPNLNTGILSAVPIQLPPLQTQLEIASMLGALDDRIALLRASNATLEAIAQAMFKSWFVDFDPVHAKQQGRAPEGMSEATAALFPDSFEESELGLVPRGWKVGTLADMAVYQNGYAFKTQDWQDTGHPVVKIGNVKPGIIDIAGTSCVSSDTVIGLERFLLKRGDLLVGMTGYVGETGLMPDTNPPAYLNQRVGRISTSRGIADLGFVYCIVRNAAYKTYAETKSHGSAQANVSGTELMSYPTVLPSSDVLETFNHITHRLIDKVLANHAQAQTLATLRDTLLPRLISGQLSLPDVKIDKVKIEEVA